ncbi:MAG: polyisoprenoid-binding protein [Chloroflexi bacterium]|nr:polyisoprenoid-binding protein [Chloroflexota bacterium]
MSWDIDRSHTSIEFSARHMMVTRVKGRFDRWSGTVNFDEKDPTRSSVEVEVDVASINTSEPQRDAHLRSPDFFDAEKSPVMTYKSRRVERHGDRYRVIGDLTIRDITREVPLDVEFAGLATDPYGNARAGFSATASLSRKDFGLRWNMPLEAGGWVVGDTVNISIDAELVKKATVPAAEKQTA